MIDVHVPPTGTVVVVGELDVVVVDGARAVVELVEAGVAVVVLVVLVVVVVTRRFRRRLATSRASSATRSDQSRPCVSTVMRSSTSPVTGSTIRSSPVTVWPSLASAP
jgi:hypothetical protein